MAIDLLTLAEDLAKEFERRGMGDHLEQLRRFYISFQRVRAAQPSAWTVTDVVTWLAAFRVPPFEQSMPLADGDGCCPCCGAAHRTPSPPRNAFPGGAVLCCGRCGRWSLLESPSVPG